MISEARNALDFIIPIFEDDADEENPCEVLELLIGFRNALEGKDSLHQTGIDNEMAINIKAFAMFPVMMSDDLGEGLEYALKALLATSNLIIAYNRSLTLK